MRNLKKILALALALIMSLSLVTTAGAFSDDGSINADYQDAVDVLSELKVFQGYSDGEFKPQNTITRAEVAAIIYRIVTGDVTDTQAGIHSTWGMFTDVQDGAWYAGYVNYCANAKYVKGVGNGQFKPQNPVTGYEALAMILRAVGYDKNSEFTGSNWQVNTASIARERGVLKNVTEGLLGQPASRELVAEVLFRSIIIPKVEFNTNTLSYSVKGAKNTIGYESFKLEEVTGVIEANEKADLEGDKALAEGKVRMSVKEDGKLVDYILNDTNNDATGFDALGESYHAYVRDHKTTSTTVLKMAKSEDSKSWDTWSDDGIESANDFRNKTGFTRAGTTVQLINYGERVNGDTKSDWRIRYEIVFGEAYATNVSNDGKTATMTEDNLKAANDSIVSFARSTGLTLPDELGTLSTAGSVKFHNDDNATYSLTKTETAGKYYIVYSKEFKMGAVISGAHQNNIKWIFNYGDKWDEGVGVYVNGEVYVGTTSVKDVSDSMSYSQFVDEYLKTGDTATSITKNNRGNYLKVIDNDNDGQADYVLKTIYTMAQVVKAKDGKYGLDLKKDSLCDKDGLNWLDNEDVKTEDSTLSLGDIVYYAMIDGQGWAYKSESETVKVTTVNRADRKINVEGKDDAILESDVCGTHVVSKDYSCGVTNMNGYTTYTIYKDGAGNVALFEDANSGDFKLIIDGWYNRQKSSVEYAVWTYNDETGRQEMRDVTRGGSMFISGDVSWDYGPVQNNDWNALKWLGGTSSRTTTDTALRNVQDTDGNGTLINEMVAKLNGKKVGVQNVKTTVATLTADGVLQPADYYSDVTNRTVRMIAIDGQNVPDSSALYKGTAYRTDGIGNDTAYNMKDGDATVEIRALATTTYYFVYPSSSAESGFSVERYVGYANLPKFDESKIEDVYAVGTLQSRESTLGRNNYYTANVIVVEMDSNIKYANQVFIYNLPEAGSNVDIETVEIIREDGTKDTIKVDMAASGLRGYRNALEADGSWGVWGPGLYYLYETATEGLYHVARMSAKDIAANNYATGYVSTSGGTAGNNYVEVYKLSAAMARTDYGFVAYDRDQYAITSNNVYKMKWNSRGLVDGFTQYNVDERIDIQKFLPELADGTGNTSDFVNINKNRNRVLVHYNDKNVAQYVISFTEADTTNGLAKQVWNMCVPGYDLWKANDRKEALRYANFMVEFIARDPASAESLNIGGSVVNSMADWLWENWKDDEVRGVCGKLVPGYDFGGDTPVTPTPATYTVTVSDDVTADKTTATEKTETVVTLTAKNANEQIDGVTVTVNGTEITNFNFANGVVTIPAAEVTGNIVITAAVSTVENPPVVIKDVTVKLTSEVPVARPDGTVPTMADIALTVDANGNVTVREDAIKVTGFTFTVIGITFTDADGNALTATEGTDGTVKTWTVKPTTAVLNALVDTDADSWDIDANAPDTPPEGPSGDGTLDNDDVNISVGDGDGSGIGIRPVTSRARAAAGEAQGYYLDVPEGKEIKLYLFVNAENVVLEETGNVDSQNRAEWKLTFNTVKEGKSKIVLRVIEKTAAEEEILPYKAIPNAGTYELYGYGKTYAKLTAEQVAQAIAVAEKVDPSQVTVDTKKGVATITNAQGEKSYVKFVKDDVGLKSSVSTGELRKVSYNGKLVDYVKDSDSSAKVTGLCGGGNGIVAEKKEVYKLGATVAKDVSKGELTVGSVTDDVEYVDVIKLDVSTVTTVTSGVEIKDGMYWTRISGVGVNAINAVVVPVGGTVRFVLTGADITAENTYNVWFTQDTPELREQFEGIGPVTTKTDSTDYFEFVVPALPAEMNSTAKVEFIKTTGYTIFVDGVKVADNVTVKEADGKTDTYVALAKGTKLIGITPETDVADTQYWSASETEVTSKKGVTVASLVTYANEDREIRIYTDAEYAKVTFEAGSISNSGNSVKVSFADGRGSKPLDLSSQTNAYILHGATLELVAADNMSYITATVDGKDAVKITDGEKLGKEVAKAEFTIGEGTKEITIKKLATVKKISLPNVTADLTVGSNITLNDLVLKTVGDVPVAVSKVLTDCDQRTIDKDSLREVETLEPNKDYIVEIYGVEAMDGYTLEDVEEISATLSDSSDMNGWFEHELVSAGDGTYTLRLYLTSAAAAPTPPATSSAE